MISPGAFPTHQLPDVLCGALDPLGDARLFPNPLANLSKTSPRLLLVLQRRLRSVVSAFVRRCDRFGSLKRYGFLQCFSRR